MPTEASNNLLCYMCEPNPSGRGSFVCYLAAPAQAGDVLIVEGKRFRVNQVQHITSLGRSRKNATPIMRLILGKG